MNSSINLPKNRDFKGVWIPAELYLNTDLSAIEKFIIVEIDSLSQNGLCYASNQHFADFLGLSVDRVKHIIPDLVKRGYLYSQTTYNPEKRKKERILSVSKNFSDQSAKNDTTQSAKNDTISNTVEKYNNNIYTVTNTCSKVNIEHDNNNLSDTVNCIMLSADSATESHEHIEEVEKVHFTHDGQIIRSLSKAFNRLHLKRDISSRDKITDFFLYFTERYTEHAGHKPFSIKFDKLILYIDRLVDTKLINGGYDSLLNYTADEIEWMIDDYFNYNFEDCNYSIHHFMSKEILSTRFRRLQNKFSKIA